MPAPSRILVLTLVLALGQGATIGQAAPPASNRLHLLTSDRGSLIWSADPNDPESSGLSMVRTCASFYPAGVCPGVSASDLQFQILAYRGSTLEDTLSWDQASPLRYHLRLDVEAATPFTVHGLMSRGSQQSVTPAATEVSPGVWEVATTSTGSVEPSEDLKLGVSIKMMAPVRARLRIELHTAGASWIDLPHAVPARAVPRLLAEDTYAPEPSSLRTAERSFSFNDRDWDVVSFTGDLSADKTIDYPLARPAAIVVGWMEGFSEPFVYGLLNGDPNARKPTDSGSVRLDHNGEEQITNRYWATEIELPPGTLSMTVERTAQAGAYPYRAYLLVIYGSRTLGSMRWPAEVPAAFLKLPSVSSCAGPTQEVPTTSETTTWRADLTSASRNPLAGDWTLGFRVPGYGASDCGLQGQGPGLRVVKRGAGIATIGPNAHSESTTVSAFDTRFEMQVTYAYTPPCELDPEAFGCPA